MLEKILLHERKPDFRKEIIKVLQISSGAFIVVTLIQLLVSFKDFDGLSHILPRLLVNFIISSSITTSAVFSMRYLADNFPKKLNLYIRLFLSFLIIVFSLIFGVYLGQFLVWILGIVNDPYFLGESGFWFSFLFSCVVAIIVTIYYGLKERLEIAYEKIKVQEQQKSRLEVLKAKAELDALQSKINPHFLFNSLNSIAGLATIAPDKVEDTILKLAELFRSTIKENGSFSSIEEEIRLIKNYLNIEKIRFGERLNFTIEVDKGLNTFKIPHLLIQPLVENAIKHGIEPQVDGGTICISVKKSNGQIRIVINDDGIGIKGDVSFGYGLSNIKKRLENLYKDKYSIDIKSEKGTIVSITIPAK